MSIKPTVDGYRHLFVWHLKNSIPVNTAMYKNRYVNVIRRFFITYMDVKNKVEDSLLM